MKKLIWFLSGLLALLSLFLALGVLTDGAEGLAYVTSGSMEPTLHVGDGFVLWPVREPQVGDVITFRPLTLNATTVTHRIVAESPLGFVTQGDHNPQSDQAGGEPPVTRERILGKALAVGGRIIRIPQLRTISEGVRDLLKRRLWAVAVAVVGLSLLLGAVEQANSPRPRQPRRRWRIGRVHRAVIGGAAFGILVAMLMNVQVRQVEYLVTMSPGANVPGQVALGVPGAVRLTIANDGPLPVYAFSEGISPAVVSSAPEVVGSSASAILVLQTPARTEPGWYHDYVRLYRYPPVLPRWAVAALHRQSPYLAMIGIAFASGMTVWALGLFLNGWMPVRAMQDRRVQRLLRRAFRMRPSRRRSL